MQPIRLVLLSLSAMFFIVGCNSASVKARRDQRERLVKEGGKVYCEFLNGEQYPDIDIALNLEMAKRCDPEKSISVTNYKSPSEATGLIYCCAMAKPTVLGKKEAKDNSKDADLSLDDKPHAPSTPAKPEAKPEEKKDKN